MRDIPAGRGSLSTRIPPGVPHGLTALLVIGRAHHPLRGLGLGEASFAGGFLTLRCGGGVVAMLRCFCPDRAVRLCALRWLGLNSIVFRQSDRWSGFVGWLLIELRRWHIAFDIRSV
ncbi:MAG: hypothetical protein ACNA8P_12390 [Phycisphaerales bacterium]